REFCAVNQLIHGVDDGRVEASVDSVKSLVRRLVDVPAYAEVERQLAAHFPVVLKPGCVVVPERSREDSVFNVAAYVTEKEGGDAVAALRVAVVEALLSEASTCGQSEGVALIPDDVLRKTYVHARPPRLLPANPRHVRVCGDGIGEVIARIPANGSVAVA